MENRGKSFIVISSSEDKRESYKNKIIETLDNKEIFNYDATSFKKDDFEDMMFSYNQRVNSADTRVFIINNYSKMSRLVQNKMLVTLENLPETKVFILCSETLSGILPTIISRSVIVEDNNNASFDSWLDSTTLKNISASIEEGDLSSFDKILNDNVESLDESKKFIVDLMSLAYDEKIKQEYLNKLVSIYEDVKIINSTNIVKIKIINTLF